MAPSAQDGLAPPVIDPSLAALSESSPPVPPLAETGALPASSHAPFSSLASTTASLAQASPYDLPDPSTRVFPYADEGDSAVAGSSTFAYDLPVPPAAVSGDAPFSTSSVHPTNAFTAKGKGNARACDNLPEDPVLTGSPSYGARVTHKRARPASEDGSSGTEEEEEDEEEQAEEDGGSPAPETTGKGKGGTSTVTRRRRDHRHGIFANRIQKAGGVERLAGRRVKYKGVGGSKGVVVPLLPEAAREKRGQVKDGELVCEGFDGAADLEQLLVQASEPDFATSLVASLVQQQERYARAYQALNDELFKAQVEESVLNNVKQLLVKRRDDIRHAEKTRARDAQDQQ
ncbi:hypothetical protein JCM11251_003429 [Rhodosporidiobolus azoricus]